MPIALTDPIGALASAAALVSAFASFLPVETTPWHGMTLRRILGSFQNFNCSLRLFGAIHSRKTTNTA